MKKTLSVLLCLAFLLFASACGSSKAAGSTPVPTVNDNPTSPIAPSPEQTASTPEPTPAEATTETPQAGNPDMVDVDLTQLSSTMVYSEVYAMATEPEQYIGKTVKMQGLFATQEYNGSRLYACIVQDATACCAEGLEFELAEDLVFPDDYPEPGERITVIGTFDSYTEDAGNGNTYMYLILRNARFV